MSYKIENPYCLTSKYFISLLLTMIEEGVNLKYLKVTIIIFLALIVLVIVTSFIAKLLFNNKVNNEVKALYNHVDLHEEIVQKDDIADLPTPVKKWLEYAQVIGKEKIYAARIKQKAEMRLEPDSNWMSVEATQYFSVQEPGFIWDANVKAAPLLSFAGRDKYFEGRGNMLIKILSLVPVADGTGKEVDQGTLLRFLAETMWFPTAALHDYITWEEVDNKTAKATMSYKGVTASGIFSFNEKGEVIHFVAERYGDFNGGYSLETWAIPISDYKEFDGIKIPTKGKVTWKLDSGDFNWFNFEITHADYNKPNPF